MSKSFKSLLGITALVSALIFTAVAAGQYSFLSYQLRQRATHELSDLTEGMKQDIAFNDSWNLEGYRRTSTGANIYVVLAENGTLIDTEGYLKGMVDHVSMPFRFEYERPFQVASDIGEVWNLYVHRLNDGLVILGARVRTAPPDVAQRFVPSATRFGNKVGDALGTPERAIDEAFDYAVIDAGGNLRWAIGGIPLKTAPPEIPDHATPTPVWDIDGSLYSGFIEPVTSKSGRKVGVIRAFEEVTGEQKVLHQSAIFNGFIAALLLCITVVVATLYLRRVRVAEISCAQIPSLEESDTVEFKSSLRWDYKQQRANTDLEREVIKGVVGFLNSESGGTLIIGVDDDKQVLGLERDYSTLGQRKNRDGFQQRLQQTLLSAIGERCCAKWVKVRFCSVQGNDVCVITVNSASEPIFFEERGREGSMYVRVGNTTRPLSPKESVAYASARWSGLSMRRSAFRRSIVEAVA
jgi:schlafen family protein